MASRGVFWGKGLCMQERNSRTFRDRVCNWQNWALWKASSTQNAFSVPPPGALYLYGHCTNLYLKTVHGLHTHDDLCRRYTYCIYLIRTCCSLAYLNGSDVIFFSLYFCILLYQDLFCGGHFFPFDWCSVHLIAWFNLISNKIMADNLILYKLLQIGMCYENKKINK